MHFHGYKKINYAIAGQHILILLMSFESSMNKEICTCILQLQRFFKKIAICLPRGGGALAGQLCTDA